MNNIDIDIDIDRPMQKLENVLYYLENVLLLLL